MNSRNKKKNGRIIRENSIFGGMRNRSSGRSAGIVGLKAGARAALYSAIAVVAIVLPCRLADAATIWAGPDVTVSQPAFQPDSVIDVLIPGVASLQRSLSQPLCNTLQGDVCGTRNPAHPTGIEFAFSGLRGNPPFPYGSAAKYEQYNFGYFRWAAEGPGNNLPNLLNATDSGDLRPPVPGVAHIIAEDIYFDIEIQYWGTGLQVWAEPGAFTYRRSAPSVIPVPAALPLLAGALIGLFALCSKKRDATQ